MAKKLFLIVVLICRDFSEMRAMARERAGTRPKRPTRSIYRAHKTANFIIGER